MRDQQPSALLDWVLVERADPDSRIASFNGDPHAPFGGFKGLTHWRITTRRSGRVKHEAVFWTINRDLTRLTLKELSSGIRSGVSLEKVPVPQRFQQTII